MNDSTSNSALVLLCFGLLVAFLLPANTTPKANTDKLDQLLDDELFIEQLSAQYKPVENIEPIPEPIPDVKPTPEEPTPTPEEPTPIPNQESIPEFKKTIPIEPRRRFLFRRGLSHELSGQDFGCIIRHASQYIDTWSY